MEFTVTLHKDICVMAIIATFITLVGLMIYKYNVNSDKLAFEAIKTRQEVLVKATTRPIQAVVATTQPYISIEPVK